MAAITGLHGSTGEEWYSWPVGATTSAIAEVAAHFSANPDAVANITESIATCDRRLTDAGAILGGLWAPDQLDGLVAAQWWAGVTDSTSDDDLRSARRYERSVSGRAFDGATTVFAQSLSSFFTDTIEAVMLVETRSEGDGCEPYALARAVWFPTWTKDRAVLEAVCPIPLFLDEFASTVMSMAQRLSLQSDLVA